MTKTLKEIYSKPEIKGNRFFSEKVPVISYEVFPPKNDKDGMKLGKLLKELAILKKHDPALVSVTYGAGGSNQNQSLEIIERIKNESDITPMPHFTCVSTSRENISGYLNNIEKLGIKNILALRGDVPEGAFCHDFEHASDLVEYINGEHKLSVSVAGYPEGHIESDSLENDLKWLKFKVGKGADVIYTQLFFDNTKFFSFRELCDEKGIFVPIIPGILPVTSCSQLQKMASLCKVTIPSTFIERLEKHSDDSDYTKKLGIDFATYQCRQLIDEGVDGLHFYTLNKSYAVSEILDNIL